MIEKFELGARVKQVLCSVDKEINLRISAKHRGYRNCISPSLLSIKDTTKQSHLFFDPDLLRGAGLIDDARFSTLYKNKMPVATMTLNCVVGTFLDTIIVEDLAKSLIKDGIIAIPQMPVISKKYGIYGSCDLLIITDEGLIVIDLKTTGNKVIDRLVPELYHKDHYKSGYLGNKGLQMETYMRQLHAYGTALSEMFDIPVLECGLLNLSKVPSSRIELTEAHYNDPVYMKFIDEHGNCQTPLTTNTVIDWAYLDKHYTTPLEDLYKNVKKICVKLHERYPSFNSFLIDEELCAKMVSECEEKYEAIQKELGI
jgi:hypothetical protein